AAGHAMHLIPEVEIREPLDRLGAGCRLDDVVPFAAQERREHTSQVLLVIRDEDLGRLHRALLYPVPVDVVGSAGVAGAEGASGSLATAGAAAGAGAGG